MFVTKVEESQKDPDQVDWIKRRVDDGDEGHLRSEENWRERGTQL